MSVLDWILLAAVAAGVVFALRSMRRHKGCGCGGSCGCGGNCSACAGRCGNKVLPRGESPDRMGPDNDFVEAAEWKKKDAPSR
jgi:hypothetical protein